MLSRIRHTLRRTAYEESGSMVIAVLVSTIAAISLGTALSAIIGGLNSARTDQNRTNAFQFANAGIDHALYLIDRGQLATNPVGSYVPTVSDGVVTGFSDTVTVTGSGRTSVFAVNAFTDPPGQSNVWTVRSTGTDPSGRKRLAIATVTASPLFVDGFFTLGDFKLSGAQDTPVAYRSSTCPTASGLFGTDCNLGQPIPSRLGTNGTFSGSAATIEGFRVAWSGFQMYGRATQAAADDACGGGRCGTAPKVAAVTDQRAIVLPKDPDQSAGCPNGGNLGASVGRPTLPPGNYVCNNLSISGNFNVGTEPGNGTGTIRFWIRGAFSVSPGSVVNFQKVPARMVFYQNESPGGGSVCGAEVWGLLYTPGLPIDCNGSHQAKLYGAVVARVHSATGNHFDFHWDLDSYSAEGDGRYVVKNWRECAPGAPDC
jgi:hypothetical protein